ncbi:MAG: DUF1926 domain-containing protein, partial [Nitrospinae bacterium]|nr:DUF1926 domain-containing protein [Nitrospinota bacterium]
YQSLIRAERLVDGLLGRGDRFIAVDRFDYDKDCGDDVVMTNPSLLAVIDPDLGGTLLELDYRPADFCLSNTLTRQKEAYHHKLTGEAEEAEATDAPASIHDLVRVKEEGLAEWLVYDKGIRRLFTDRLLPAETNMTAYVANEYEERGAFADGRFVIEAVDAGESEASVTLSCLGAVATPAGNVPLTLTKIYRMNDRDASLTVEYLLENADGEPVTVKVATELNLTLLAVDAEDRYWTGGSAGQTRPRLKESLEDDGVNQVGLADEYFGFAVTAASEPSSTAWRFPVYTVSQSEGGFERTYQGSCMTFVRSVTVAPGEPIQWSVTLSVKGNKEKS